MSGGVPALRRVSLIAVMVILITVCDAVALRVSMSHCRAVVSVVKSCQRCGTEFGCGLSCCWCDEITVSAELRANLQENFSDCLCRRCFETLAAEHSTAGSTFAERATVGDG
jgi:hypothetical protein